MRILEGPSEVAVEEGTSNQGNKSNCKGEPVQHNIIEPSVSSSATCEKPWQNILDELEASYQQVSIADTKSTASDSSTQDIASAAETNAELSGREIKEVKATVQDHLDATLKSSCLQHSLQASVAVESSTSFSTPQLGETDAVYSLSAVMCAHL